VTVSTIAQFEYLLVRKWPVLPILPGEKKPHGKLVPNGVKGASADRDVIGQWIEACPEANWAVACGHPGPQVLDIDHKGKVPGSLLSIFRSSPRVRTARGGHVYFKGTADGTKVLAFGELRGAGSYVLIPPSVHPSGALYRWVTEPRGKLHEVPRALEGTEKASGSGRGEQIAPTSRVPEGKRHYYLTDFAVRLLRGGLIDEHLIAWHLRCEFERACISFPSPQPGYFDGIARWAVQSRIAEREARR
jgi:hypothetical protein